LKSLLFIALTFCACATTSHFQINPAEQPLIQCSLPQLVVLASDVPDYDEHTIINAMEYWNQELGAKVFIFAGRIDETSDEIKSSPGFITVKVWNPEDSTEPSDFASTRNYGNKCITGSRIRYLVHKPNRNYRMLEWAMRHEFFHTLVDYQDPKDDHSPYENDLMYRSMPSTPVFVPRARREEIYILKSLYNLE
jgi:hypothetical protein